ncbi:MAG: phage antirepressor KilAC domain-containing protein [Clostridia bacterium]|nr:phage antirepressor KilAC domain-containing protein [Clostridia bacterium]
MNDLIELQYQYDKNNRPMISGLMLHQALGIKTPYRKWFPRVCEGRYVVGEDYVTSDIFVRRLDGTVMPNPLHDHWITIDMAKEICMMQDSEAGRQFRRRFIAKEEAMRRAAAEDSRNLRSTYLLLEASEEERKRLEAEYQRQAAVIAKQNDAINLKTAAILAQNAKINNLDARISNQGSRIMQMQPKADYYDEVLSAPDTYNTTTIAKDYGLTAKLLNDFLHAQGIQFKNQDGWHLYRKYDGKGYTKSETVIWDHGPYQSVHIVMRWTQKGRELIDQLIRNAGWKPGDKKLPAAGIGKGRK